TDTDEIITGLDFTPPVKFTVYYFAEDNVGRESSIASRGLPLLVSSSIQSIGSDQFTLRVNIDEAATTYYVVTQSPTAPTSAQIIAGQDENGDAPDASGNFAAAAAANTDKLIAGLDDVTTYYVHFVARDATDNESIVE